MGTFSIWHWLIVAVAVAIDCLVLKKPFRKRSRSGLITGKAYVTDGDGIRVSGQEVRFAGLDAPEWDQMTKGYY